MNNWMQSAAPGLTVRAPAAATGAALGVALRDELGAVALRAMTGSGFGEAAVVDDGAHSRPAVTGQRSAAYPPGGRLAMASAAACALVQRRVDAWRRWRKASETHHALRELDARTLHDIGLHASEIRSVAAEIGGSAESTRLFRSSFAA